MPPAHLKLRSDERLVSRFRAGREEAFDVLHARHHRRLHASSASATPASDVYTLSLHDALPISSTGPTFALALLYSPVRQGLRARRGNRTDRKSTRLNSSHVESSYAVFCLKKKMGRDRDPLRLGSKRDASRPPQAAVGRAPRIALPRRARGSLRRPARAPSPAPARVFCERYARLRRLHSFPTRRSSDLLDWTHLRPSATL